MRQLPLTQRNLSASSQVKCHFSYMLTRKERLNDILRDCTELNRRKGDPIWQESRARGGEGSVGLYPTCPLLGNGF
jgi:hypothetical protein